MDQESAYPSIAGKVVLVTGAGAGIGRAIAQRFASVGARVALNDVDSDRVDSAVGEINAGGGEVMGVVADVSDSARVNTMIAEIIDAQGVIDVLVNNAGIVSPMLHFFGRTRHWWRASRRQPHRHFLVSASGRAICRSTGRLPVLSSAVRPGTPAFTHDATERGIGLDTAMALDLGPYNIRVNALMPIDRH